MLAYDWNFLGLSLEAKPMTGEKVVDGSTFYECDTCDFYIFYQGEWYKQTFVTEDGINVYLYKSLMKKMFGKLFDSNITKSKIIKPDTGTDIEFTTSLPAQIIDLTGYGDSTQQTYTGKNLVDALNVTWTEFNSTLTKTDGVFKMTASSETLARCCLPLSGLVEGTTYTFSCDIHGVSISSILNTSYLRVRETSSGGSWVSEASYITQTSDYVRASVTFTATSVSNPYVWFYISANASNTNNIEVYAKNLQLEVGSTDTDYEPYVGGIPAPNPQYPQDVHVVTGEQTVTVSDGTNSQSYTVDLGTIELCKLDNYQDYIYKGADGWYVHKTIGKITYTGDSRENWQYSSTSGGPFRIAIPNSKYYTSKNVAPLVYCDYYTPAVWNSITSYRYAVTAFNNNALPFRNTDITSLDDWKTWLGSHNTTVYYPFATPTDTKITDATLVAQLNALLNYTFPVGVNNITITADELPMPLKLIISEKE